jgi:hypothetical protein
MSCEGRCFCPPKFLLPPVLTTAALWRLNYAPLWQGSTFTLVLQMAHEMKRVLDPNHNDSSTLSSTIIILKAPIFC